LEQTNLGPEMDEAVLRARRRMRIGADPDYDLVAENFDVVHYLLQSPALLDLPDVDLVAHFLEKGEAENLSPDPDFSMSEYARRHPRKVAAGRERSPYLLWLKRGKASGDVADPAPRVGAMARVLGRETQEVVDLVVERRGDLQQRLRTGKLGEMFAEAAQIEPLVGEAWQEITRPKMLPLSHPVVVDELHAIFRAHEDADFRPARVVFVINRGRWGGGRRMEGHLAHALARHVDPSDMVVIYTDESSPAPSDRYPSGVRQVDFARIVGGLPPAAAQHALVMLLRTFRADAIVNINSRMLYHALRVYGRALSASERVFLVFFCNEKTGMGTWRGWGLRYFYRTFGAVAGVITDSEHYARQLATTHRAGPDERDRLHVFRAPVDPTLDVVPAPPIDPHRRPQVFWAGRWDRQKRIDLFLEVTRLMPEVDFRMWGEPVMGSSTTDLPPNVVARGVYERFSDLPLDEADAWLYTSAWDGVPSLLLEVVMTGIPIVGTRVGGTGEVLTEPGAWPVGETEGADAYVRALREVIADPERARRSARALRDRMLRERTEEGFARQAADLLLRGGATPGTVREAGA
jgi:glycosyltransferase involved in cell wall biosynthesis